MDARPRRSRRACLLLPVAAGVCAWALALPATGIAASADAAAPGAAASGSKITICHATGSSSSPYVRITVDVEGLNGHGDHAGDLIPAPPAGCPSGAADPCVKAKLPCDSIPELPKHLWLLVAVALGVGGSMLAGRLLRGRGGGGAS